MAVEITVPGSWLAGALIALVFMAWGALYVLVVVPAVDWLIRRFGHDERETG